MTGPRGGMWGGTRPERMALTRCERRGGADATRCGQTYLLPMDSTLGTFDFCNRWSRHSSSKKVPPEILGGRFSLVVPETAVVVVPHPRSGSPSSFATPLTHLRRTTADLCSRGVARCRHRRTTRAGLRASSHIFVRLFICRSRVVGTAGVHGLTGGVHLSGEDWRPAFGRSEDDRRGDRSGGGGGGGDGGVDGPRGTGTGAGSGTPARGRCAEPPHALITRRRHRFSRRDSSTNAAAAAAAAAPPTGRHPDGTDATMDRGRGGGERGDG